MGIFYDEMVSVGMEIAGIPKNALPTLRVVQFDNAKGAANEASRVAEEVIQALTEKLTETEAYIGEWQFEPEPRYIAEGYYEHVKNVMEGDLSRCTTTRASAQFTDGSPVTLPTEEVLAAMLAGTSHAPDEDIGPIQLFRQIATVEDVAKMGIMAGMGPEHMPLLLALTECMVKTHDFGEQLGGADGWFTYSTIISGLITVDDNVMLNTGGLAAGGPAPLTVGVPSNTGIGRFHRLMMVNIGGIEPGILEAKGIGHPAKTGIVVAEAHIEGGWPGMSTIIPKDPIGLYGDANNSKFGEKESTVSLFVAWGDMMYGVNGRATDPTLSPDGVVPETRPASADWLTDAQYSACRTQLNGFMPAAKWLNRPQQGLMVFIQPTRTRALANAGVTREMAARWVSELCTDTNSYARTVNGLGGGGVGGGFTIQGENLHAAWNSNWWMPANSGNDAMRKLNTIQTPDLSTSSWDRPRPISQCLCRDCQDGRLPSTLGNNAV